MPLARPLRTSLCAILALCLLLTTLPLPAAAAKATATTNVASISLPRLEGVGSLSAQSAVLIDAASGQVLYGKDEHVRLPMASTTKVMTALCAAELGELQRVIRIPAAAVGIEGSSVYLRAGEKLTLEQLLYALLLASANDAATAIAISLCGSIEAFAERMNEKAAELGLKHTHFENPHGLDSEQHYTTAHDLALIARAALQHPTLRKIMATRSITIPLDGAPSGRTLVNHNKMLRNYAGAIGVKTGFTKKSGRCLVSAAEREGLTLIAVTLHAPDDWNDHARLLDAGFAHYENVVLCAANEFTTTLAVTGGKEAYVVAHNSHAASLTLPRKRGAMLCTVELERFLYADVARGEVVGTLVFCCDANGDGTPEELCRIPIRTAYGVQKRQRKTLLQKIKERLTRSAT